MERLFQYVYYLHAKKLWIIRRRGYSQTGACYQTQEEAAKIAARLFRTTVTSLKLQKPSAKRETRRFLFVYWDRVRQLWQVKRKGYSCNLYAPTQIAAARLAAKEFHITLSDMKLHQRIKPTKKKSGARQYKFVYYDKRDQRWQVRRSGFPTKSGFETQLAAAKFAATLFGETLKSLSMGTRRCMSMHVQAKRFQDLWRIYRASAKDAPSLPGDLEDLLQRATSFRLLRQFPGLIVPLLLAKFQLHRDILMQVANHHEQNFTGDLQDTGAQAKWLLKVLQVTMAKLSKTKLPAPWVANVGRNNCHHSGLIQLVRGSLGMLSASETLDKKIRSLVLFGECLLRTERTTTLAQWTAEALSLKESIAKLKVAGFKNKGCYRALWVIRLWLIWCMRLAKCPRLRLDSKCTVKTFRLGFPDQRQWALRFARGVCTLSSAKIIVLFQTVGYDGPPELFSMFTCLFGDTQLNTLLSSKSPTWLSHQSDTLSEELLHYKDEHGIVPHPAVLVMAVAAKNS
jgi:hypothetical protein